MMHRALQRVLGVLVLTWASACASNTSNEPDEAGLRPKVGDSIDGGRVTHVLGDDECRVVTIQQDPEWECSDSQRNFVREYPFGAAPSPETPPSSASNVALEVTDCEGLADLQRPTVKQLSLQQVDQARYSLLKDKCFAKTRVHYFKGFKEVSFCQPTPSNGGSAGLYDSGSGGSGFGPMPAAPPNDPGNMGNVGANDSGAKEYSTTNNQVADVDEADFVKNDAGYVYVLSRTGLHVIDAWPAPETKQIAHVQLPGEPRRLFLAGDRLVVYSRVGTPNGNESPSSQGCTYGYSCRFTSEGGRTTVTVFDVSNPASPEELTRYEFSGGYVASRRVGSVVYTVVVDGQQRYLPDVDFMLVSNSPEELEEEYERLRQDVGEAVDSAPAAKFLPWLQRVTPRSQEPTQVEACDHALAAQAAKGMRFVSVIGFDVEKLGEPSRTLIAGKPGYVYASKEALYLATDGVDGSDSFYYASADNDQSTIHKFSLEGVDTVYRGSVAIPGHVLNQFAMDELEGVLRVATSNGWVPDPKVSSNLVTIAEQGGKLKVLGHIGGIAPTEDIRSVRFDGTRGFVVTFKKTDPLFVFDLTDPKAPKILGELKIPGFSTYMHPLDRDHLLAIGFDADDHGTFAYFDGIQIQIFDVSELSDPRLLHKTVIGTRGSASEALMNHLAFNYFPSKSLLALPMTICEGGNDGVYGTDLTFSGLMVFDVSLEQGITEKGRMPFVDPKSVASQNCSNWWSSSTSSVKRSIFMDDYAIGISDSRYQVAELSDLSNVLRSLPLGN